MINEDAFKREIIKDHENNYTRQTETNRKG